MTSLASLLSLLEDSPEDSSPRATLTVQNGEWRTVSYVVDTSTVNARMVTRVTTFDTYDRTTELRTFADTVAQRMAAIGHSGSLFVAVYMSCGRVCAKVTARDANGNMSRHMAEAAAANLSKRFGWDRYDAGGDPHAAQFLVR